MQRFIVVLACCIYAARGLVIGVGAAHSNKPSSSNSIFRNGKLPIRSLATLAPSSTANPHAYSFEVHSSAAPSAEGDPAFIAASTATSVPSKLNGGDASMSSSIFNMAKSIVGAGVLSLPSGVAFFSDSPQALVPASLICAVFGLVAAYSFSSVGKVCADNDADSFQEAWAKTVSPKTAGLVSACITALCFCASLAYSIIIGESFTSLAQTFKLPVLVAKRTNVILLMSSLVIFPLVSLQSLSALAPFSLFGIGGLLYTWAFMFARLKDKSYAVGGKFVADMAKQPVFNSMGPVQLTSKIFVLVSMLSTSFVAHYNAPKFYAELKDASVPRFNTVVYSSFISSILFYILVMGTGFLTFGGSSLGFALNNYSNNDPLATIGRIAIGLALVTSYPFTFVALRDGILDMAKLAGEKRKAASRPVTVGMLSLLTGMAIMLKDVGFVVSISGALFGCGLMFVIPALMNIANIKKLATNAGKALTGGNKTEIVANYGMIVSGLLLTVLGVLISVLKQIGRL